MQYDYFQKKMKKVNKQCLLDTPPPELSFEKKISVESVQTNKTYKLLHANVQCVYIVSAKYQIAPSKAVVLVDQPIKTLSMCLQNIWE